MRVRATSLVVAFGLLASCSAPDASPVSTATSAAPTVSAAPDAPRVDIDRVRRDLGGVALPWRLAAVQPDGGAVAIEVARRTCRVDVAVDVAEDADRVLVVAADAAGGVDGDCPAIEVAPVTRFMRLSVSLGDRDLSGCDVDVPMTDCGDRPAEDTGEVLTRFGDALVVPMGESSLVLDAATGEERGIVDSVFVPLDLRNGILFGREPDNRGDFVAVDLAIGEPVRGGNAEKWGSNSTHVGQDAVVVRDRLVFDTIHAIPIPDEGSFWTRDLDEQITDVQMVDGTVRIGVTVAPGTPGVVVLDELTGDVLRRDVGATLGEAQPRTPPGERVGQVTACVLRVAGQPEVDLLTPAPVMASAEPTAFIRTAIDLRAYGQTGEPVWWQPRLDDGAAP